MTQGAGTVRVEHDTLGPVEVPAERLWGAQTQRALGSFRISDERVPLALIHALALVKKATALANVALGELDEPIGTAIVAAAEEVRSQEGRIMNPNFRDYKIPTIHEMDFPIDLAFIETDDSFGPFGAKGVGEPGLVPTAPAIANAIYNAVGIRIHDLPITPEKVLEALKK